jgi:hypothetical protein
MKMRLSFTVALLCLVSEMGWMAGCGSKSGPTAPSVVGAPLPPLLGGIGINVTGNGRLTAPGQTTQLSAEETFSDGSKKNVTSTAQWISSDRNVATVSGGLVTAVDLGKTSISAIVEGGRSSSSFTITVLPEGTYILSGWVTEPGDVFVTDVRVEIIGGPMSGRAVMTDQVGEYAFNGVSGVAQVRATKAGYLPATQNVSQDTEHVHIVLTPSVPYEAVGGVYRLMFKASSSCHLPDDAVSRTYTATIDQPSAGARLTIELSDARFADVYGFARNRFFGFVHGNAVSFTLFDAEEYYADGVVEELPGNRYLSLVGTANGTVTGSTISAAFAGSVNLTATPTSGPIATCAASNHQLIFMRTTTTTFRTR